jgi:hypothetical protein
MSRVNLAVWGCAASAVALAAFFAFRATEQPSESNVAATGMPAAAGNTAGDPKNVASTPAVSTEVEENSVHVDLKAAFTTAPDLWNFAEGLLQDAKAGDSDSQYYLAHTLHYCDSLYGFYFIRGKERRTLDEGLQWASTRVGVSAEEARTVHSRCHELMSADDHPFGTAEQWLNAAAGAGQPLAQIDIASRLAIEAGVGGDLASVELRDDAKRLALDALRSKDAQVIFQFADVSRLFGGDPSKAAETEWAWRLAACHRGYDCGPNAEWLRIVCRLDYNCQPQDDGVQMIRRNFSQNFDVIESKAKELNAKLDANRFDLLF